MLSFSACPVLAIHAAGLCFILLHLGALTCLPLLPLALRAGARSHTHPCGSMGCQESSVWHVLRWRWERARSSPQRVVPAPPALPLLSTKLSPQQPIQKLLFGEGLALLGLPGPWGGCRCFPKLRGWSSPWVGNSGKAFAELQVILPFIFFFFFL